MTMNNEPVQMPCRRSAKKLGVGEVPIKGGGRGYLTKKWGNGHECRDNARWRRRGGGLPNHNSPISYRMQPKMAREQ